MATTVTATAKGLAASYIASLCDYIGALDATAELSGGSYVRLHLAAGAFRSPAASVVAFTATWADGTNNKFTIPAAKRVTRIAYYSASTGDTYYCIDDVTPEAYAAEGTYTLTSGSITVADPA